MSLKNSNDTIGNRTRDLPVCSVVNNNNNNNNNNSIPVTGLEWPRMFQEVKVPRFHDNGTGWW